MRYQDILITEMRLTGNKSDSYEVLAHKGDIWVWSGDLPTEMASQMSKHFGEKIEDNNRLHRLIDDRPDILFGYVRNGSLHLINSGAGEGVFHDPRSSLLIRKVVQRLGLDNVTYNSPDQNGDDSRSVEVDRFDVIGDIPEIVYHGTAGGYLRGILSTGLRGDTDETNWREVGKLEGKVFLTVSPQNAEFHARNASENTQTPPVVLGVRIPDRNKIVPDFDILRIFDDPSSDRTDKHGYTDAAYAIKNRSYDRDRREKLADYAAKTNFTRDMGIMAYEGRIPPKFIVSISIPTSTDYFKSEWHTFEGKNRFTDAAKAIYNLEELGGFDPYDLDGSWLYDEEDDEY